MSNSLATRTVSVTVVVVDVCVEVLVVDSAGAIMRSSYTGELSESNKSLVRGSDLPRVN